MQFGNPIAGAGQVGEVTQLFSGVMPAGSNQSVGPFFVPPTVRTLIIEFTGHSLSTGIVTVSAAGLTPRPGGFLVYQNPPYLSYTSALLQTVSLIVVPVPFDLVFGIAQGQVVIIGSPNVNAGVTVWGDTGQYDESVFYNGSYTTVQAALVAAGNSTILNGPARLLTLNVDVTSGGGTIGGAFINPGGNNIIRVDTQSSVAISFPPNTIITSSQSMGAVQVNPGAVAVTIGYAYP